MKYGTFEKKSIEILSLSRSYSKGKSFAVFCDPQIDFCVFCAIDEQKCLYLRWSSINLINMNQDKNRFEYLSDFIHILRWGANKYCDNRLNFCVGWWLVTYSKIFLLEWNEWSGVIFLLQIKAHECSEVECLGQRVIFASNTWFCMHFEQKDAFVWTFTYILLTSISKCYWASIFRWSCTIIEHLCILFISLVHYGTTNCI